MSQEAVRGQIYRCPICRAEITVLARMEVKDFRPHCCNTAMEIMEHNAVFYMCEVCGAEVAAVRDVPEDFRPRCCSQLMIPES